MAEQGPVTVRDKKEMYGQWRKMHGLRRVQGYHLNVQRWERESQGTGGTISHEECEKY